MIPRYKRIPPARGLDDNEHERRLEWFKSITPKQDQPKGRKQAPKRTKPMR